MVSWPGVTRSHEIQIDDTDHGVIEHATILLLSSRLDAKHALGLESCRALASPAREWRVSLSLDVDIGCANKTTQNQASSHISHILEYLC